MPRECNGRIAEILIRDADSSEPEIDVTCGSAPVGAAAGDTAAATPAPAAATPPPGSEPPRVEDQSLEP
jgi:hypothetical protein